MRKMILTVLVVFVASTAHASETDWLWYFGSGAPVQFGTNDSASDDLDASDIRVHEGQGSRVGVYHEPGSGGWTGEAGFYASDVRSPLLLVAGERKTWVFYLWATPLYPHSFLEIQWGWDYPSAPAFDAMEYSLRYARAAEGTSGGSVPVGTSISLNQSQQGTWNFPVHRTEDGRTGHMFELTARVVPEPSSLLALGVGGIGILGAALRRRVRGRA